MKAFDDLNRTYKLHKQFINKTTGLLSNKYRNHINTIGDKYESLYMDILLMSTYLTEEQVFSYIENCSEYVKELIISYRGVKNER